MEDIQDTIIADEALPNGIQLIAVPDGQPSPSVKITWCIEPRLLESLKSRGVAAPYMLLSVVRMTDSEVDDIFGNTETMRYLVPLELGSKYVSFSAAGTNRVWGTVVWSAGNSKRELENCFLTKGGIMSGYKTSILTYTGDYLKDDVIYFNSRTKYCCMRTEDVDHLDIEVPDRMFAKPLPRWRQLYEKKFFLTDGVFDECNRRKRWLLLWPLLPLYLVITTFLRLGLAAALLLGGYSKTHLSAIVKPFAADVVSVYGYYGYMVGFTRPLRKGEYGAYGKNYKLRPPIHWIKAPLMWLLFILLGLLIASLTGRGFGQIVLQAVLFTAGLAALFVLVASIGDWVHRAAEAREDRILRAARAAAVASFDTPPVDMRKLRSVVISEPVAYERVVCGIESPPELPVRHKVTLWLGEVKHRVCKPVQRV